MKLKTPITVLAVLLAGCGSSAPEKTAATGSRALRFAQCMRDHGVPAFPDPDASGELTIDGVVNGSSIDPDGPAFERALGTCRHLQPAGFTGDAHVTPARHAARLRFAACVRAHGVRDFPDPADDEPLIDTRQIPSTATEGGMTILNAAMDACRSQSAAAGVRP